MHVWFGQCVKCLSLCACKVTQLNPAHHLITCRPPVYTVRVNTLRGTTVPALLASLQAEGVEACASSLLPDDFIEIRSGLQTLLAKVCVRAQIAFLPLNTIRC